LEAKLKEYKSHKAMLIRWRQNEQSSHTWNDLRWS